MEKTYEVRGMTCVICKNNVEKTVLRLDGVETAKVNLLENELSIRFNENKISENQLAAAIKNAGYEMIISQEKTIDKEKLITMISVILVVLIMYLSMGHMIKLPNPLSHQNNIIAQFILSTAVIILNNRRYRSALTALKNRNLNMDVLVSLSTIAAYGYSLFASYKIFNGDNSYHIYFETSATIMALVALGKYIEGQTKAKTGKVIRGLSTLIPMETTIITAEGTKVIPSSELKKNDICLIRAGESIPQDGIVVKGHSFVDESLITGESLPVSKNIDDKVIGGTINLNGVIEIKITTRANQTVLSNIIMMTKEASQKKIPIERFADTVSRYFVLTVIAISLLTFVIWMVIDGNLEKALGFAISVLVVSCPCALGLATPSAIAVANGVAAKNGILIKDPGILEVGGKIKTVIFDKTGTLTQNRLSVCEIREYDQKLSAIACSLEKNSSHPIARAILEQFSQSAIIEMDSVEEISGMGIVGKTKDNVYLAGNKKLMDSYQIEIPAEDIAYAEENFLSMVMIGEKGRLSGIIYLQDTIREESVDAISRLFRRNISPLMCTGDNEIAAREMAKKTGIKEYLAQVEPKQKEELVAKKKQEGIVAMVGDGINDAIALSSADISFSIASGSDIASASSDVILMKNDLSDIAFTYDLCKMTMRIIRQNMFWALFYNSVFIPVAAGALYSIGITFNPMFGAFAMTLSSIFVLSNALRINTIKKEK